MFADEQNRIQEEDYAYVKPIFATERFYTDCSKAVAIDFSLSIGPRPFEHYLG